MGESDQPISGSANAITSDGKKPSNNDEGKPYRGRRNQDRQRSGKQRYREGATAPTHVHKEKFVGRSDDLKGFIYDVTNNKGGVMYSRTTEEIAQYVGEKYTTTGSFIRTAILTLTIPAQARPAAPIGTGTPPIIDPVDL
jgi:hypothetical protein